MAAARMHFLNREAEFIVELVVRLVHITRSDRCSLVIYCFTDQRQSLLLPHQQLSAPADGQLTI